MRAIAAIAALLLAAACGRDSAAPAEIPADPDTLVLRTQELRSGPAPWERGLLPTFSLYGGGRVIVPDTPAGALQRAREFEISAPTLHQLVADAHAAGLHRAQVYEDTDVVDAGALIVTLGTVDTRISAPESAGRVLRYLKQLPRTPPGARDFPTTALAVLATPGVSAGPAAATPWPLHPLADGIRTTEGRCVIVTGAALAGAMRLARTAQQRTRWSSGDQLYAVSFRPLLPDEHRCADIDIRLP
ncbi:hypothetical protein WEI85_08515 [Actinomycetes bacterium KLBMP 9797]